MLKLSLWRTCMFIATYVAVTAVELNAANATSLTLLSDPIEVTADVDTSGNYASVQISVHNGPITQLVSTNVQGNSLATIERTLKRQVTWHDPYLLVHSSCGSGNAWRCESETVFKKTDSVVIRLGDLIGTATEVYKNGHFYDVYDKLEQQVDGLSQAASPNFKIVLNDINSNLTVNAAATWTVNAAAWTQRSTDITATHPEQSWNETEWEHYFSAVVNNAVLARYCQHSDELQQLLQTVEPELDTYHRRALADALSKVVPLERPKAWRKTY